MNSKKIITLLLATSILFSAGCSSKTPEKVTSKEAPQKTVEKLKIISQYDEFDPNNFNTASAAPAKKIEELTGTKVEYAMLPGENGEQKLYMELAASAQYNIVKLTKAEYGILSAQGALLDMKQYLDKYAPNITKKGVISDEMWKTVTQDGKVYGIPEKNSYNHINNNLIVRKDILDKYSLKVPTTTDEFYDVCKQLVAKGMKSPLVSPVAMIDGIKGAFGIANEWTDVNGSLVYMTEAPGFQQYADYMKKLYDAGALGKDPFGTLKSKDAMSRFVTGDAAFLLAAWWNAPVLNKDLIAAGVKDPETATVWIQSLVGPDGKKGVFRDKGVSYVTAIPKYMETYAKQSVEYLNKKFDEKIFTQYVLGEEGKEYKVENGKYIPGPTYSKEGRADWYLTGAPEKLWENYWPVSIYSNKDMYTAWSKIQEKNNEFGVFDPIKMAPPLKKWGSSAQVISGAAGDELMKFVNGNVKNFDGMQAKLKSEDITAITSEVNDWYKNFKK